MKKIIVLLALLMPSISFAGQGIFPTCYARGGVYLEITPTGADGYVGADQVHLTRDGDQFIGTIGKIAVDLVEYRDNSVKGTVGDTIVEWTMNEKGTVIYGYHPCPAVIHW